MDGFLKAGDVVGLSLRLPGVGSLGGVKNCLVDVGLTVVGVLLELPGVTVGPAVVGLGVGLLVAEASEDPS